MTVGELKVILEGVPDEARLHVLEDDVPVQVLNVEACTSALMGIRGASVDKMDWADLEDMSAEERARVTGVVFLEF